MAQNYFTPNMVPITGQASEMANLSMPLNVVQFQPMPVQFSPYVPCPGAICNNYSGFCTNLPNLPPENQIVPIWMENQKENLNIHSPKVMNMPSNGIMAPKVTETPIVENISTTMASQSNETSSELKK